MKSENLFNEVIVVGVENVGHMPHCCCGVEYFYKI